MGTSGSGVLMCRCSAVRPLVGTLRHDCRARSWVDATRISKSVSVKLIIYLIYRRLYELHPSQSDNYGLGKD